MRYLDRYNNKKINYFIALYKQKIQNNKINIQKKKVGSGTVGQIFEISFLQNNKIIFKFIIKNQPFDSRFRYEKYFNYQTAQLINRKITPNFIKHFDSYILNNQVFFLMENADRGLDYWSFKKRTFEEYLSFAFQILSSLYVFKKYIKGCHYDVSYQNIMYIKLKNTQNKYFEYKINKISYYVPIYGKLFLLIDFGRGRSLKLSQDTETQNCIQNNTDLIRFKNIFDEMKYLYIIEKLNLNYDYQQLITQLSINKNDLLYEQFIIIKSKKPKVTNQRFNTILQIIDFMKYAEINNNLILNTFPPINEKYLSFINQINTIDNFYVYFQNFTIAPPKNNIIDTFKIT